MPPSQPEPSQQQLPTTTAFSSSETAPGQSPNSTPLISTHQPQDIDPSHLKDPQAKRRFFGLGKKTEEQGGEGTMEAPTVGGAAMLPQTQAAINAMRPDSAMRHPQELKPQAIPVSPSRHPYQSAMAAASPSRLRSSSPRMHSPASSEIFERNVQEPVSLTSIPDREAQHIAPHVMTEDHIPPALEASAQAITSEDLNVDEVEIVTSSSHQPAAASVLEGSSSHADLSALHSGLQSPLQPQQSTDSETMSASHQPIVPMSAVPHELQDDGASNYGSLDPNDVRRLSFISFADVVQSEHQHAPGSTLGEAGSRDSLHIGSFSGPSIGEQARAASPLRSPRSPVSAHSQSISGGLTTPPPGVNVNMTREYEQSPVRSIGGISSQANQHGELNIETMRQAVRKTASGDLSGGRGSMAMSPVSADEASFREARSRTNS